MIKENQRLLNISLVLIDVLVVILSLACSFLLRFNTTLFGPIGDHLPLSSYVLFLVFAVIPTYLILYFAFGLYKPRRTYKNIFSEATQIIKVNVVAFFVLVSILFIINQPNFSRIMLFLLAIIGTFFGIIERFIVRSFLRKIRINNRNLKHILIVGDNDLAFSFAQKIKDNPYLGYVVSGFYALFLEALVRLNFVPECFGVLKIVAICLFVLSLILSYVSFLDYLIHFGKTLKQN